MMNYNSSASVEFGALQSKAPYVGPAEAFEGFEEIWRNANTDTMAFLPYRSVGDDGKPIPAPQRWPDLRSVSAISFAGSVGSTSACTTSA